MTATSKSRQVAAVTALAALLVVAVPTARSQSDDTQEPKSPAARGALAHYEREVKRAERAYISAVQRAQARLRKKLEQAKLAAMRSGNLDEANAIQAQLDSIAPAREEDLVATVQANASWQEVGEVTAGSPIRIRATGAWTNGLDVPNDGVVGPKGLDAQLKHGLPNLALVARVGDGEPFLVGDDLAYTPDQGGALYMMMNRLHREMTNPDRLKGSMRVRVEAAPPEVPPVPQQEVEEDEGQ